MSNAYFLARGDVPLEQQNAYPPWACTGCFACRNACDHRNDVAGTLLAARGAIAGAGAAPPAAMRVVHRFPAHDADVHTRARALGKGAGGPETLLVGCMYLRRAEGEANDALEAASALLGHAPRVLGMCCGLPLLLAGDRAGFARSAERVVRDVADSKLIVCDPGCALAVGQRYPEVGVISPEVELLVEMGARTSLASVPGEPVRYHDPCQLGRGLGVYDAPRQILTKVNGAPPIEMDERAVCSGAGGLLPITMPEVSAGIARSRIGGVKEPIVTACASSLVRFRRSGARALDIVTYLARGLR
jgi:Fe-S oxidoreductase